jgi:hypothetical protein
MESLQAAYKRLVENWHTNRQQGDHSAFEQLTLLDEAIAVLTHPLKRTEYDQLLRQIAHFGQSEARESQSVPGITPKEHPTNESKSIRSDSEAAEQEDQPVKLTATKKVRLKEWYEPGWHWLVVLPLLLAFIMLKDQHVFTGWYAFIAAGVFCGFMGGYVALLQSPWTRHYRFWTICVSCIISISMFAWCCTWIQQKKERSSWTEQEISEARTVIEIATQRDIVKAVGRTFSENDVLTQAELQRMLTALRQRRTNLREISHAVLSKIHPELPEQFAKLLKFTEANIRMVETGLPDTTGVVAEREWDAWYITHYKEFNLPK